MVFEAYPCIVIYLFRVDSEAYETILVGVSFYPIECFFFLSCFLVGCGDIYVYYLIL